MYLLVVLAYESTDIKILKKNAAEYSEVMDLIYQNNQQPGRQILHNGHIAVELLLKALLMKYNDKYPETHEIKVLCQIEILINKTESSRLYSLLNANGLGPAYKGIRRAWNMNDRYSEGSIGQTEAIEYYKSFKEVLEWIKTQC